MNLEVEAEDNAGADDVAEGSGGDLRPAKTRERADVSPPLDPKKVVTAARAADQSERAGYGHSGLLSALPDLVFGGQACLLKPKSSPRLVGPL